MLYIILGVIALALMIWVGVLYLGIEFDIKEREQYAKFRGWLIEKLKSRGV